MKIINRLKNGYIPQKNQKDIIEFYINNNMINENDKIETYELIIKYTLSKEMPISFDSFKILMADYADLLCNKKAVIEIHTEDYLKKLQDKQDDKIMLSEEELEQMYHFGYYAPLITLFKEIKRFEQYRDIYFNEKNDLETTIMLKDKILGYLLPNYFRDNKDRLYSEIQASIYSIKMLNNLFSRIDIKYKDGKNPYDNDIITLQNQLKDNHRMVDGKLLLQDDIFNEEIVKHPELLERYTLLTTNNIEVKQ